MKFLIAMILSFACVCFAGTLSPQDSLSFLAGAPTGDDVFLNYSALSVTSATYTEVLASTTLEVKAIEIFDSSGAPVIFATGAASSEVDQFITPPGGVDRTYLLIPASTRISVKARSTGEVITTGTIIINFFGQ